MTNLSVNINKIATLRNARGGDMPNVIQAAIDCQRFGADGITIHPRPDQRHITKKDAYDIKHTIKTCLLYTSPSPRDATTSRMPSSA